MLTVGNKIEVTCIDVDFQGQGVCRFDNYVIFASNLVIGEQARIEIKKVNKRFAYGIVLERLSKSDDRKSERHVLGSLDLYHLTDEAQNRWQEKVTKDTLYKAFKEEVLLEDVISAEPLTHYRNKLVYHPVVSEETLKFGLYDIHHKLVVTDGFILAPAHVSKLVKTINQSKLAKIKHLKHLVIRTNQKQEMLVTLVLRYKNKTIIENLVSVISKNPQVIGITLNVNDQDFEILGKKSYDIYLSNTIQMDFDGYQIPIFDQSFFQVNDQVNQEVLKLIKKHMIKNTSVIDAYSGVGSIGFSVSSLVKKVTMVEINKANIEAASAFAKSNQIHHVDFLLKDANEAVADLDAQVLIVDPPRKGLDKAFIEIVNQKRFEQIIYMSCDLKTLARDLVFLKEAYTIDHIYPIRMFPQTTSAETLVILSKN